MLKAHLLLVDGDPVSLGALVHCFRSEPGITLSTAVNPHDAWKMLQDQPGRFDLMILDCLMRNRGGLDLLLRIGDDRRLAGIPIILQTPLAPTAGQVREGTAAGPCHYLTMPCGRDAAVATVHAVLAKSSFSKALCRQLPTRGNAPQEMAACEFAIRTLEEAGELATLVAQACPSPEAAVFGVSELLVNGVEHGNLGLSYGEKSQLALSNCWKSEVDRRSAHRDNLGKRVRLSFRRESNQVTLRNADDGQGFAWQDYLELDPRRACDPNGRGIALSRIPSFSSVHYEGCGSVAVATIAAVG